MKKTGLIIVCILTLFFMHVDAQYQVNKTRYDYKNYVHLQGDPYNPGTAAVGSLFIPGLGQMICGEGLRGTAFLLGCIGSLAFSLAGALHATSVTESDPSFWHVQTTSKRMISAGLVSAAVFWIWSVADASRVAKVNNLVFRDKNKTSCNIGLHPCIDLLNYDIVGKAIPGLSLKVTF